MKIYSFWAPITGVVDLAWVKVYKFFSPLGPIYGEKKSINYRSK